MSSNNGNHPLPSAAGQQQRPRTKESSFSFRSNHSHKSSTGSGQKIDLHETHQEKERKRLTTKANPSMALTEAEPSAIASDLQSSLGSIRAIQHRDAQGNPIADPDRSNPTRSRWERPLDTIRSFEAAIDGNYSRKSYIRTESGDSTPNFNRRSSYYGGTQVTNDERARHPQNGYYSVGRSQSYRPESAYIDGRPNGMSRPDSYYNNMAEPQGASGPSNGYYPNRARYPRTASEPHFNNVQGIHPVSGNQQSYETVTTASGSGSSADPAGYSTDPSSENSSLDRIAPPQKEQIETYGFNGFGNTPQYQSPGSGINDYGAQQQGNGYQPQGPQVPRKQAPPSAGPIRLGASGGDAAMESQEVRPPNEKRKSWFGKRFSKKA